MSDRPPLDYQSKQDVQKEANLLRTLFGPSHQSTWQHFAQQHNATLEPDASLLPTPRLTIPAGPWTFHLDITRSAEFAHTRMRTSYVNPSRFRFALSREGLLTRVGKLLGLQDLQIGIEDFDAAFLIKSNHPENVRQLLADAELRRLLQEQPPFEMLVRDTDRFAGPNFTKPLDELSYQTRGAVRDLKILHDIHDLFTRLMHLLHQMGLALPPPSP